MDQLNQKYIMLLLKRWWIVILAMILTGSISYYVREQLPNNYTTSVKLLTGNIQETNLDINTLNVSERLARTYAELINNSSLLEQTINELDLNITIEQLAEAVNSQVIQDTSILSISVTYDNPTLAADIANTIAQNLIETTPSQLTDDQESELERIREQIEQLEEIVNTTNEQSLVALQELNDARDNNDQDEIPILSDRYTSISDQLIRSQETLAQQSEALIELSNGLNRLVIIDLARPNFNPDGLSSIISAIIGSIAGVILAIGSILFVGFLDKTISSEKEAIRLIDDMPIAFIPTSNFKGNSKDKELVIIKKSESSFAEAFRRLLTLIVFPQANFDETQTILITSPNKHEGRTFVATNLALAITQYKKNVMLIDADTSKPRIHKIFSLKNHKGVIDALKWLDDNQTNRDDEDKFKNDFKEYVQTNCIYNDEDLYPNLSVIPIGDLTSSDKAKLLNNKTLLLNFYSMINEFVDERTIIIDSSPRSFNADSYLIASKSKANVLLVMRQDHTDHTDILKMSREFEALDNTTIGVILDHF